VFVTNPDVYFHGLCIESWRSRKYSVQKGKDFLEDLGVDGSIILKFILQRYGRSGPATFIWLRIGSRVGFCENGHKTYGCIKGGEFLD
jgi:hypothetical protein